LLHPFLADLRRLDPEATAVVASAGYDSVYREPVRVADGTPAGASARREKAAVLVRCQFEDNEEERLRQLASGASPQANFVLTFHFADLEAAGLVDAATGTPLVRNGDRLAAVYNLDGSLMRSYANPPGMFAIEVKPSGLGIGDRRNLLVVTFDDRIQGAG